jgi:hypothetical protein
VELPDRAGALHDDVGHRRSLLRGQGLS